MSFSTIFTKFQYFIFLLKKQSESQSESRQKAEKISPKIRGRKVKKLKKMHIKMKEN